MVLGFHGHENWRDMSEFVVHFTKKGDSAQQALHQILGSGRVESLNAFGSARKEGIEEPAQRSACFAEIPLEYLDRLVAQRSSYGVAFRKARVIADGGGPVWYVEKDSPLHDLVKSAKSAAFAEPENPIWRLTPFIDHPGTYGKKRYRFEWEREWRVPGGFDFAVDDVAFLLLPERDHVAAKRFFEEISATNDGPAYLCPYIDPLWGEDRLREAFATVAAPMED